MASICCSPPERVPARWCRRSFRRGKSVHTCSISARKCSTSRREKVPISRFSNTLMRGKMRRPSGAWAIPRRTRRSVGKPSMRCPSSVISPWRGYQAHNSAQGGRLSCTVTPDERDHFSALDFQRDAAQGPNVARSNYESSVVPARSAAPPFPR